MKAVNVFKKVLTALMAIITGVNVITIVLQVLFRYFLKKPIAWTNELAGISLVWITFLGATLATIDETHIGFDGIIKKLKPFPKFCMRILCNILMGIACYVFIKYGFVALRVGRRTSLTALPGNVAIASCIIPISGIIMILALVLNTVRDYRKYREEVMGVSGEQNSSDASLYNDVPEEILERSENSINALEQENEK